MLRLFGISSSKLSGALYSSWPYGNQAYRVYEADPRQRELFNNLARYTLEFVDIDAKKIASFKKGTFP
jgi:hypothetical protein